MKSVLALLKEGCTIKFPSGYIIKGDPKTSYIDTFIETEDNMVYPDGLRILDKDGVRLALADEKKYRQQNAEYDG